MDKYKQISQEFGEEGFVNISINYNNKYNVTYLYKYSIRIYIIILYILYLSGRCFDTTSL